MTPKPGVGKRKIEMQKSDTAFKRFLSDQGIFSYFTGFLSVFPHIAKYILKDKNVFNRGKWKIIAVIFA